MGFMTREQKLIFNQSFRLHGESLAVVWVSIFYHYITPGMRIEALNPIAVDEIPSLMNFAVFGRFSIQFLSISDALKIVEFENSRTLDFTRGK